MSCGVVIGACLEHRYSRSRCVCLLQGRRLQLGVGMLEFLLALLIFSVGMLGLMSAQLAGKRAVFEAEQRSTATALARDILERIRANPDQLEAYEMAVAGDESARLPPPGADCDATSCTAQQLAAFDVWQWQSLLRGESEKVGGRSVGGLVSPTACVRQSAGEVRVTISWLTSATSVSASASSCDAEDTGPTLPDDAGIEVTPRSHLALATFIAG